MSDRLRIVIVGGVAAGPKAAARARRLAPDAEITIVEKGSVLSYAGCGMPYYVSGLVEDRADLMSTAIGVLRDPEFFGRMKRITALNRTEAIAIDRQAKELEVRSVETGEVSRLPYDKLILATGATPVEPPIPGADLPGVLRLKEMEDADTFRALVQRQACPYVVIIGGGLIGMEMTEALTECGSAVTVVEMLSQILPMLDAAMAALVEKHMRANGVTVWTGTTVERVEGDADGISHVVTSRGSVPAQVVLLSVGIRPNVELARSAGLIIGPTGGIHVSEYMQTSDPDIFAAGDCAEKRCIIRGTPCFLPLGSVANREGRVAASNAVGRAERFPGVAGTTALKVFDLNIGRAGLTAVDAARLGIPVMTATVAAPDKPHYYPGAKPVILKLVADSRTRQLIGVQGIGMGEVIKRVDVAVTAMTAGMTVDQVATLDLAYAPPYSEALDVLAHAANTLRNKLDGLVRGVTANELQAARQAGSDLIMVDVRTPDEHEAGHIPGDMLIPLGTVRNRATEIPRDRRVVLYCKTSLRAYEASRALAGLGYDNVEILDGGFTAWPYESEA